MWLWTVTKTTTRPLYLSARRAQIIQRSISRQLAVLLRLLQTAQLVMRRHHTEPLRTGVGHRRPVVASVSCVAKSGVRRMGTARFECPAGVRVPLSVNRKRRQRRWRLSFRCRSPVPLSTMLRMRNLPNSSPFVPMWRHRLRARPESASASVWIRSRRNSRTWKVADRWAAMAIICTKAGQQHPMWRSLKRVTHRNPVSRLPLPSAVSFMCRPAARSPNDRSMHRVVTHVENLVKSGNLKVVRDKSGELGKIRKTVFLLEV